MTNTRHLLKVVAAWVTIVYIVCFAGVALVPGIRGGSLHYALHMDVGVIANVTTFATFISGLIIWNVIAFLGAWLFAALHNKIKQ